MAASFDSSKQSIIPNFLYSPTCSSKSSFDFDKSDISVSSSTYITDEASKNTSSVVEFKNKTSGSTATSSSSPDKNVKKIELYSPAYYYASCALGGICSCDLIHWVATQWDKQNDSGKYKSISSRFHVLLKEQGLRGFFRGPMPTMSGYWAQNACKFGFYEFFKKTYSDIAGPEYAAKYRFFIYLAGSASAEAIADIALCPFEAVKVRVQTQPGFAKGLFDGFPKFVKSEGYAGLYKGLVPLWRRHIPYTMINFAAFETFVENRYTIPPEKDQSSTAVQLGLSFAGGVFAGVCCATAFHYVDNSMSIEKNVWKDPFILDAVKKRGIWRLAFNRRFVGHIYRGLALRSVMIGTLTGAQWMIYDACKLFFGFPATCGVTPVPVPPPAPPTPFAVAPAL